MRRFRVDMVVLWAICLHPLTSLDVTLVDAGKVQREARRDEEQVRQRDARKRKDKEPHEALGRVAAERKGDDHETEEQQEEPPCGTQDEAAHGNPRDARPPSVGM